MLYLEHHWGPLLSAEMPHPSSQGPVWAGCSAQALLTELTEENYFWKSHLCLRFILPCSEMLYLFCFCFKCHFFFPVHSEVVPKFPSPFQPKLVITASCFGYCIPVSPTFS